MNPDPTNLARLPARLFDEYRLIRMLGDGINGVVFLAEEIRTGTPRAVKQFALGPDASQRFFRELSFLFALNHPNLVRCTDFIHGSEGLSCLVLEFADAGNLRQRLGGTRPTPLPPRDVLSLARQISCGLAALHSQGIVHCDLKPENILLFQPDLPLRAKLTDFGIARLLGQTSPAEPWHGSPLYMAPEQFYEPPSPAADIYALGTILFEALAGRTLRDPGTPQQIFAQARLGADLESIEHPGWRQALARLLDLNPARRPQDDEQLAELWDSLEDRPPPVRRPTKSNRPHPTNPVEPWPSSCPPEPPWPTLAQLSAPAANCLAPHPNLPGCWIGDGRGLDYLTLHPTPSISPRRDFSGCTLLSTDGRWLAHGHGVAHYDDRTNRFRRVADLPAIALLGRSDGAALADHTHLTLLDRHGRVRQRTPAPNYGFPPALGEGPDGCLWFSSGPVHPKVLRLYPGEEPRPMPLPGPALVIFPDRDGIHLLCQGSAPDEPGSWFHLQTESDEPTLLRPLPPCLYRARAHAGFVSAFDLDHRVHYLHLEPERDTIEHLSGSPLDDLWIPEAGRYLLLLQSERRRMLLIQECAPATLTAPTAPPAPILP